MHRLTIGHKNMFMKEPPERKIGQPASFIGEGAKKAIENLE